jgi:alpha-N-arabinofuranosidase
MRISTVLMCGALLVPGAASFAAEAPEVRVTLDLAQTRTPISKYVYGQFIEHLGRCIYGGMWAEMLEDRKFFYPVDGQGYPWAMHTGKKVSWEGEGVPFELLVRSPWMVVGDLKAISMTKDRPFVGEHTPVITADGTGNGIFQERLGVVGGRRYVGRVVLAGAPAAAPVDVTLVWGIGASDRQTVTVPRLTDDYVTTPLAFTAGGGTDNARLEIVARGRGAVRVGTVSLMPADNLHGWRADTLALLKELDAPIYRWPGGNFVSG